jgi:type IX secretion system PorP/SprF family membrane protein
MSVLEMKKIILSAVAIFSICYTQAQELPIYRQYLFNDFVINPAIAGTKSHNPASLNLRKQWVGIKQSPNFQSFTLHGLLWNQYVGLGGGLYNFSTGPSSQLGAFLSYSYHINLKKGFHKMTMGLSASAAQYMVNQEGLVLDNPVDKAFTGTIYKTLVGDASFGVYFLPDVYCKQKYYFGATATNLLQKEMSSTGTFMINPYPRRYYALGGYFFKMGDFRFEPSVLVKATENGKSVDFSGDVNAKFHYKEVFWFGGSYRMDDAAQVLIGFNTSTVRLGYAYEIPLNAIGAHTSGSHEISFGIWFSRRQVKKF